MTFTVTSIKVVPFVPQNAYSDPPKITPVTGAKLVTATVTVRNDGQTGVDPFCGGTGAILLDEKDRNFEPLSQAQLSIPGNTICSDEIQPGFKATNILVFQMPKTATPTSLAVWNSASTEDYDHSSYVLFTR